MSTTCPICVKTVLDSEEGLGCDGECQRWFHRTCINMLKTEYVRISADTNIKWHCSREDCHALQNQPLIKLSHQMTSVLTRLDELLAKVSKIYTISQDVSTIKSEVSTIRDGLSALEPRVSIVEDRLSAVEEKVAAANADPAPCKIEDYIAESNERIRRSKNIMVYNLKESASSDINTKKAHDSELVLKLFSPVLSTLPQGEIKSVRVGKKLADKPRPLKVVLSSPTDVSTLLGNFAADAAAQSDPAFSHVKLSRDRTPRELQHLKDLNAELELRKSRGEKELTIKFVNNVPQIVKNLKNA